MAWDSSRPVPWRRLIREWLIYVAILAVVFAIFFRDRGLLGVFAGLLASGPIYLALGAVMAKFGYERKTLRQARQQTRAVGAGADASAGDRARTAPRPKPAPTRRTGGGSSPPRGRRR
jgi:hypothetical protein